MAIRLEVQPYCESCCDFEVDIIKPEKVTVYGADGPQDIAVYHTDTIIRCRYNKRCEAIKRYLEKRKEDRFGSV